MKTREQLVGVLADVLLTGAVVFGSVAIVSAHSDSWLTTKAKILLLADESVDATEIEVDAVDGRVTLEGTVASAAEKAAVENLVRSVDGVRTVESRLAVLPRTAPKQMRSDAELETAVRNAFASDRRLADSSIRVVSVDEGVVTLGGSATTMTAHARALETTARVPGVVAIRETIESPDILDEGDAITEDAIAQDRIADAGGSEAVSAAAATTETSARTNGPATLGRTMQDWWITAATKIRLVGNEITPAIDIDVDTTDGVVTLFGVVSSEAARSAAADEARAVGGVVGVRNELRVVGTDAHANATPP